MTQETVVPDELERTRQAWDRIAVGYDRYVTPTGDWALPQQALAHAGVVRGTTFLDVASGSGALSLPAARLGAEVTAVDLSPAMIERLHARAREEGLTNVAGHVMDGHTHLRWTTTGSTSPAPSSASCCSRTCPVRCGRWSASPDPAAGC